MGDVRWNAIHNERIVAIDAGDCSQPNKDTFKGKFQLRRLNDFPRLLDLAYVATSDAYSFDDIGDKFTWIRLGDVSLEGLRQAFLDHESRILASWSPKLSEFYEANPNNIRHAWISSVSLEGRLGNSNTPISLGFHPNFNVIIGGRGSGKSSIVAALRQLYSSTDALPVRLKDEAETFVSTVFVEATLKSTHKIQESQQEHYVEWSSNGGSVTNSFGDEFPTDFMVTVIGQKELFERAAGDKNDVHLSSRSLISLVDTSLGVGATNVRSVDGFGRRLEDARNRWATAIREYVLILNDAGRLPALKQQLSILQTQIDAFSSPEVTQRLDRIKKRKQEESRVQDSTNYINSLLSKLDALLSNHLNEYVTADADKSNDKLIQEFEGLLINLDSISSHIVQSIKTLTTDSSKSLQQFEVIKKASSWYADYVAALEDADNYKAELQSKGLSTSEYGRLQSELNKVTDLINSLEKKAPRLSAVEGEVKLAWIEIENLIHERRELRKKLLEEIEGRSRQLRFKVDSMGDIAPWIDEVRLIAGFRVDAFLEDVPALARWLFVEDLGGRANRLSLWQMCMATGNLDGLQAESKIKKPFAERLSRLDESVRLRIGSLIPGDVVLMEFLKEGGKADADKDWQLITEGSPGQRTAAMLAFVLHHGNEPLVLDQPEDDLDSEWISKLVVSELRKSRWHRQLIVVSHNANIPVLGDADQVTVLENKAGSISIKATDIKFGLQRILHVGAVENNFVRQDIQTIMEGGVSAFVKRERKYNNETRDFRRLNSPHKNSKSE